ncbi:hypothetical protein ACFFHT_09090 [Gallibacterium melopsittaci]|uniref:Uncharacterized protein n=1 Tax=Gallibacterium melopsittaci TaxID=516063 RepID=A0ABV6HXU2_9PAST
MSKNKINQEREERFYFDKIENILREKYGIYSLLEGHNDKPDKILVLSNKDKVGIELTQVDNSEYNEYFNKSDSKEILEILEKGINVEVLKKDKCSIDSEKETVLELIKKKKSKFENYKTKNGLVDCLLLIYSTRFGLEIKNIDNLFYYLEKELRNIEFPFRYVIFTSDKDNCGKIIYDREAKIELTLSNENTSKESIEKVLFFMKPDTKYSLDEIFDKQPVISKKRKK